jgi:hypothetical protein
MRFIMFNFAKIFPAADKDGALNKDVISQAQSGRISHLFAALSATHGLVIPAKKSAFEKYSRDYSTGAMHPFKGAGALKRGEFYREAFNAIREAMGLEVVTGPSWAPTISAEKVIENAKKAEAKAALKLQNEQVGANPLQKIITALNGLNHEQLRDVMQACEVQLEALGYEAVFEPALL